jgi:hypothetical protein
MCEIQFQSLNILEAFSYFKRFIPRKYSKFISFDEFREDTITIPFDDVDVSDRYCNLITYDERSQKVTFKSSMTNLMDQIISNNEFIHIYNCSGRNRNNKQFKICTSNVIDPRYNSILIDSENIKFKFICSSHRFQLTNYN